MKVPRYRQKVQFLKSTDGTGTKKVPRYNSILYCPPLALPIARASDRNFCRGPKLYLIFFTENAAKFPEKHLLWCYYSVVSKKKKKKRMVFTFSGHHFCYSGHQFFTVFILFFCFGLFLLDLSRKKSFSTREKSSHRAPLGPGPGYDVPPVPPSPAYGLGHDHGRNQGGARGGTCPPLEN